MQKRIAGGNKNVLQVNIVEKKITILGIDVITRTKMNGRSRVRNEHEFGKYKENKSYKYKCYKKTKTWKNLLISIKECLIFYQKLKRIAHFFPSESNQS